jgi:hypothetical protein
MHIGETTICLAKSRKLGGVCVAGKAVAPEHSFHWVRPVGESDNGTLSFDCIQPNNAYSIELLDVIKIPLKGRDSRFPFQRENYFFDPSVRWSRWESVPFGFDSLKFLEDSPESLWIDGFHSGKGLNDRIPEDKANGLTSSLFLIRPSNFRLLVTEDEKGTSYRASFRYRGNAYNLKVTDLRFDRMPASVVRSLNTKEAWLTISLGLPFESPSGESPSGVYRACYKLAAAVFLREFFEKR